MIAKVSAHLSSQTIQWLGYTSNPSGVIYILYRSSGPLILKRCDVSSYPCLEFHDTTRLTQSIAIVPSSSYGNQSINQKKVKRTKAATEHFIQSSLTVELRVNKHVIKSTTNVLLIRGQSESCIL